MIIFVIDKYEGSVPILPRGIHQYPFRFQLPESALPCSFESKPGYIRYYIKVRKHHNFILLGWFQFN